MVKPSKERHFSYEDDKWQYGLILFTQKAKGELHLRRILGYSKRNNILLVKLLKGKI
jgi:hypothetical protein